MEKVAAFLTANRAAHLEWTRELCRIPSISTQEQHKGDVRAAVQWTHDACAKIGLKSQILETGGHPLVYAEHCEAPGQPTYLVYGHVDVQPTGDLKLWDAGAFDPVVKGDWLICRGSADDKGQVLLYLRAAQAWLSTEGRLPINLKFLIEAEEEIGSPNLDDFISKNKKLLACDHILISDTGMYEDGWPTITYGTRGLVYKEIRLYGPKHDLHSGSFGGSVANPAVVLTELLATLHDKAGRVNIPGFYDKVAKPSPKERAQFRKLPLKDNKYAAELGSPMVHGERGYSTNERRWIRPTLDINGIYGGYMAEGKNTIIPRMAGAKVSMRLVPNQPAAKIAALFDRTIKARCPKTVKLEILHHGEASAYMAPLDSKPMQAAGKALKEAFKKNPAYIREGGSLPILPMFRKLLGADCLMCGFAGPTCNAHGPNEKVRIPDLDRGAEAMARLFGYLAK